MARHHHAHKYSVWVTLTCERTQDMSACESARREMIYKDTSRNSEDAVSCFMVLCLTIFTP